MKSSGFLIVGSISGCGKALVAFGIIAALLKVGLTVQAFKVGPDFISQCCKHSIIGRNRLRLLQV